MQKLKTTKTQDSEKKPTPTPIPLRDRIRGRFWFVRVPGILFPEPSRTKQSFAKEADINTIMAKYMDTGMLVDPSLPRNRRPIYGDFSNVGDLHTVKIAVAQAEADFMALPSKIRDRFENDPEKLLAFIIDPQNAQECIKLGLVAKQTVEAGVTPTEAEKPQSEANPTPLKDPN